MDIQITPKKAEGSERLLQVSVPVEAVRDAEDKAARRYASKVRLPGFRPGKAPAAMVKKKFADAIRQEALEQLVQAAYQQVLEQEQLKPIAQPHVHDLVFKDGEPLTFELHVEVRPEIELPRLHGFKVTRQPVMVTDDQVREQLDRLRDDKATLSPVEGEKPKEGDIVRVSLATADESGEIPEGREYTLELGAGQAIPGVEEVVMSAKPGETIERPVRWPDDFPDEAQRGKTKTVRVTLLDVKRRVLPDLDDAFAREVGDFDSLDALRAGVSEDMKRHAERESESDLRSKLLDEIIAANPFDVPNAWVSQLTKAYAEGYQVPESERERFVEEFKPTAERLVRRDMILTTIAEREKLAATEKDVDDKVAELATARGIAPGALYTQLQKAGRLSEIERGITEDRVFAWLLERNTVE